MTQFGFACQHFNMYMSVYTTIWGNYDRTLQIAEGIFICLSVGPLSPFIRSAFAAEMSITRTRFIHNSMKTNISISNSVSLSRLLTICNSTEKVRWISADRQPTLKLNKRFVTERDQCPRRRFDIELEDSQNYSPIQIILL